MEIGDITKVASRKRMNADAEQLRDKVAKETAKIIKLKVAQDTAYWDLKEKLHQVEGNHERLQQNMVDVQMQHETISGQYQDELRRRPETLNKLVGTREICSVLENYVARLKDTLSRCRADQGALCAAYEHAADALRGLRQRAQRGEDAATSLQHQLKLTTEHQNQLLQVFSSSKQQLDTEIFDLKSKLEAVTTSKDKLMGTVNEMSRKLDMCTFDIEKKEENITILQRDVKQLLEEFNTQSIEAKKTLEKLKKDLTESLEANISLKNALHSQDLYVKSLCDQNSSLQKKIASLEEQQVSSASKIEDLKKHIKEEAVIIDKTKTDLRFLQEEKVMLRDDLKEKEKLINTYEGEIQNLKSQIITLMADNSKIKFELINTYEGEIQNLKSQIITLMSDNSKIKFDFDKCAEESKTKTEYIDKLSLEVRTFVKENEEIKISLKDLRDTSDEKIKELTSTTESQNKELDSKASTITQLMSELKTSTDIRSKLETTLQRVKKDIDLEREKVMENERQQNGRIEQLEGVVRDKEDELSKQMSIILEMRDEKERLQEKIQGMQNTIDNIQKELTGRPAAVERRDEPELDDNAVMLTPGQRKCEAPTSPIIQKKTAFLVPRKEPRLDSMLYNLLSDSSMEGDTLDASEVNRRFAAMSRGERVSPAPLAALRRRAAATPGFHSPSRVKSDVKRDRIFFKNKRDNKTKKIK